MANSHRSKSRLGVLAPAALSACMDASVLAVPAAGAMVSTVLQELSKTFMLKTWFHGKMSAGEAEELMMQRGRNGSYLVRESKSSTGDFVLTVRVRGRVSHVIIRKQHKKYETGSGEQFEDLSELVEHYRAYPIVESCGDVLRLLQPLALTRVRTEPHSDAQIQQLQDKTAASVPLKSREFYRRELNYLQYEVDGYCNLTTDEGQKQENKRKNRYRNVLPYDQTRIILRDKHETQEEGSDYINANRVQFHEAHCDRSCSTSTDYTACNKKVYIAAQGCLPNTEDDFYHMLWQHDVGVVLMLTKEFEHDKWKCSEYWPDEGLQKNLECFSIQLISKFVCLHYIRRVIEVKKNSEWKTFTHFQFQSWPDHRSPLDVESVLCLIEDVNEELQKLTVASSDKKVLCVHCSAGVGRTGTFIVLDHLISQIREKGDAYDIDVKDAVKQARKQRWGLVHNLNQYIFIYKAVLSYIQRKGSKYGSAED